MTHHLTATNLIILQEETCLWNIQRNNTLLNLVHNINAKQKTSTVQYGLMSRILNYYCLRCVFSQWMEHFNSMLPLLDRVDDYLLLSSGWWHDTALQTQDSKFDQWWSEEAPHNTESLWVKETFVSLIPKCRSGGRTRDLRLSMQVALTTARAPALDNEVVIWLFGNAHASQGYVLSGPEIVIMIKEYETQSNHCYTIHLDNCDTQFSKIISNIFVFFVSGSVYCSRNWKSIQRYIILDLFNIDNKAVIST